MEASGSLSARGSTPPVSPRLAHLSEPVRAKPPLEYTPLPPSPIRAVQPSPRKAKASAGSIGSTKSEKSDSRKPAATRAVSSAMELPLLPSGSARILLNGSAAVDGWALKTSKDRDAHAIRTTKSYYNTRIISGSLQYAHLVLDNPKRAMAEARKREAVELDNRLMNERVGSKSYTSVYKAKEWRAVAPISPTGARMKANKIAMRKLEHQKIDRENRKLIAHLLATKSDVCVFKEDHDLHLSRTAKYPILLTGVVEPPEPEDFTSSSSKVVGPAWQAF